MEAPGVSVCLDEAAFENCSSLRSASFGNMGETSTIFAGMFTGCDELSEITLSDYYAPQTGIYGSMGFQFNYNWTQEEESERLRLNVPEGSEENYIKEWRYLYAGYYDFGDDSAYQNMWTDIQWNNMNWETWEFPADETVDQILEGNLDGEGKLHPQNARYRDGFRADRFLSVPRKLRYDHDDRCTVLYGICLPVRTGSGSAGRLVPGLHWNRNVPRFCADLQA